MNKAFGLVLVFSLLFLGLLSYWPVSASKEVVLMVQECSVFVSLVCVLLLFVLVFILKEIRFISIAVFLSLLSSLFFASDVRLLGADYIMFKNKGLSPEEMSSPFLGVSKSVVSNGEVRFDWGLSLNDYEVLVFKKSHGFLSNDDGREVVLKLDDDWFIVSNVDF